MKFLIVSLCLFSFSAISRTSEEIHKINNKMGAFAIEVDGEVIIKKVLDEGPFSEAGIESGSYVLEVGNSIVYGLEQFYDLIASAEGETSFLVHSPKCKPITFGLPENVERVWKLDRTPARRSLHTQSPENQGITKGIGILVIQLRPSFVIGPHINQRRGEAYM